MLFILRIRLLCRFGDFDDGIKMVPVSRSQDVVSKLIDMVPDVVAKFKGGSKEDDTQEVVDSIVDDIEKKS